MIIRTDNIKIDDRIAKTFTNHYKKQTNSL